MNAMHPTATTVPARWMAIIEKLEVEFPKRSFCISLEMWTHTSYMRRSRIAQYNLWASMPPDQGFRVHASTPDGLLDAMREHEALKAEPLASDEAEVPFLSETVEVAKTM